MGLSARLSATTFFAAAAFIVGGFTGWFMTLRARDPDAAPATYQPLPHHVPKYPGGLVFRLAMAHDVLHERYPAHGPAFHEQRAQLRREALARPDLDNGQAYSAADDLAVSLEGLGRSDEAIAVMRRKLARQQTAGIAGKDLYTSYANLGTILVQGSYRRTLAGDTAAKSEFKEGVELVRRAIAVNPEAHFGREMWQAAHAEFLLAAMDNPSLLKKFDFLGHRLDTRSFNVQGFTHVVDAKFVRMDEYQQSRWALDSTIPEGVAPNDPARWAQLNVVRKAITSIGAEAGWNEVPVRSHRAPVAFDEPALGIVGMWRQGSGADPHFALALGELLLRVGQRFLAWTAFERASRLAERFWPDPDLRQFLRDHCRQRQELIETSLAAGQRRSPPVDAQQLREQFEAELAHGEAYQRAYQEYEAARIAAGAAIDDDHFYDAFNAGREPIASPSGREEWLAVTPPGWYAAHALRRGLAWGALAAGAAALVSALILRFKAAPATAA